MVEVFGQQYQHGTSKFTFVSPNLVLSLKTIKKVDASVEVTKENTHDAQGQVDGFTVKESKHDASLSMKISEWFTLRAALAVTPGGVLLAQFQFIQTYGGSVNALHKLELLQCMIQKEAYSSEDNQDPDMVELPLMFQKMLVDGVPPIVYDA